MLRVIFFIVYIMMFYDILNLDVFNNLIRYDNDDLDMFYLGFVLIYKEIFYFIKFLL